jgi:hypothetical protein
MEKISTLASVTDSNPASASMAWTLEVTASSRLDQPLLRSRAESGVRALSPTNVWAVGTVQVGFHHRSFNKAAIEHWDGTSWTIISSPDPGTFRNRLFGVSALSDGRVVAVSDQENGLLPDSWSTSNESSQR